MVSGGTLSLRGSRSLGDEWAYASGEGVAIVNDTVDRPRYAADYTRHFVQFAETKSLFRKPHLKTGTMWLTAGFVFQTGAMLGRHFRDHAVPFLGSFFCAEGDEATALLEGGKFVTASSTNERTSQRIAQHGRRHTTPG